jgi:hypothetical protein
MTSTDLIGSARTGSPLNRSTANRSGAGSASLIAAALFLAVVIAEAAFIALAASAIPGIGSLFITVT